MAEKKVRPQGANLTISEEEATTGWTTAGIRCTSDQPHRRTTSHRPGRLPEARRSAALRALRKRAMQRGHSPPGKHAERLPTAKGRRPWP